MGADLTNVKVVKRADCCIVGGGPAGVILALLLSRQGVKTVLLEAHSDFDRDFRGDTIHPSTLELMDQIGLIEKLLALRHVKARKLSFLTPKGRVTIADLTHLSIPYPYIAFLPQSEFLAMVVDETKRFPNFELMMGTRAVDLIKENGTVCGVQCENEEGTMEVRAPLTVGADGRGSQLVKCSGLEIVKNSPPMDVLWFTLPRRTGDDEEKLFGGRTAQRCLVVILGRPGSWQIGYIILKGDLMQIKSSGIELFRESIRDLIPEFSDRVAEIKDWSHVHFLSVGSSRLKIWHVPGLLLLGDAAHTMSPVGGVGINCAIQDAVAAANILAGPLKTGTVTDKELAAFQSRRELPTRLIQGVQRFVQKQIVSRALKNDGSLEIPWIIRFLMKLPLVRNLPARFIAYGFGREVYREN